MLRTTRTTGAFGRLMASLLAVAIAGYSVPANLLASTIPSGAAEISGIILQPDGLTPITGATIKAANLETKEIYSSEKTSRDGVYRLASLPAGSYDLAVETSDGLYASDTLVTAVAGKRQVVSLAIRSGVQEGQESEKPADGQMPQDVNQAEGNKDEPSNEPQPDQAQRKKRPAFWKSFGGQSLIVGSALVIGFLWIRPDWTDNDDDEDDDQMSDTRRSN